VARGHTFEAHDIILDGVLELSHWQLCVLRHSTSAVLGSLGAAWGMDPTDIIVVSDHGQIVTVGVPQ
jgi:hypothetical protein